MNMKSDIKERIKANKSALIRILLEFETEDVAKEELRLSINALENNNKYTDKKVESIASYLPMNLPLYSLVIYGIIPKICADVCNYRPSSQTIEISKRIHNVLNLNKYNIFLFEGSREDFFRNKVYSSNVVIFVGKTENANHIKNNLSSKTMFIYFGIGHNPVIVADNANKKKAAIKICEGVMFNYGQDCAKPNIILCKKENYKELKKYLILNIRKNMYKKNSIKKKSILLEVAELLNKDSYCIEYGGKIDVKNQTLDPVIITKNLSSNTDNYKEYYAPIFLILLYNEDSDLKIYFSEEQYYKGNMNISLFGESKYINSMQNSIVLDEQMVSEFDNGNNEFGGYGIDVSSIYYKGIRISKPILINREIQKIYFNDVINSLDAQEKKIEIVLKKEFEKEILKCFDKNLIFAFMFGEISEKDKKDVSSINFLICLKNDSQNCKDIFEKWYFETLYTYGIKPEIYNPGIIITEEQLNYFLEINKKLSIKPHNNNEVFKAIYLTNLFTSEKKNVIGNKKILENYENEFKKNKSALCEKIFDVLVKNDLIENERDYTKCLFASSGDLNFLYTRLTYDVVYEKNIDKIITSLDDGLFRIYLKSQKTY